MRRCKRKINYRNKYFFNFEIDLRSNLIYYKLHFFDVWETIFLSKFSCLYDFVISFWIFRRLQTRDHDAGSPRWIISFHVRRCKRKNNYRNKTFSNLENDLRAGLIYYKSHFFDVWETLFLSNFLCRYDFAISILDF